MQSDPTRGGVVCTTSTVSRSQRALSAQWFAGTDRTGGDPGQPSQFPFEPLPLPARKHAAARYVMTFSEQ
jgi:hypothetical protein